MMEADLREEIKEYYQVVEDQPAPTKNERPAIWDLVIDDMRERDQVGLRKYGTRLQPHNGRDCLVDAYQEALDMAVYLRQKIQEDRGARGQGGSLFEKNAKEIFRTLTHAVHSNAVNHGWWEEDRGTEPLLLMHAEISEAVEALREGNPESLKIPGHSHVAEELADTVIRILDYCGKHDINIGAAVLAKHRYNLGREYRHGGKKF